MGKRLIVDLTDEQAREYADWTEAVAFRIVDLGDGTARLQVTGDLELITRPDGDSREN